LPLNELIKKTKMADESDDLVDNSCASEAFNGKTDGQIVCKHIENSVDVCEDELVPEPNGNVVVINSQNDIEPVQNNVMEIRTLKSSLKRRPPVAHKPILVKYQLNKEGCNGQECSQSHNDNDSLNSGAKSDESDLLKVNCVRKREGGSSRDARSSAGASGGIFSDEFQHDFGEFNEESIDETVNGK
jgi:hypothetical protein